jgi:hypothetical protein
VSPVTGRPFRSWPRWQLTDAAEDAGRRWAELTGAMTADAVVTLPALPAIPTRDAALQVLEEGLRARAPMMLQVGAAPWFDALRGDERMERLRREVGFR